MLDQLLVHQVRRRGEAAGLPVVVELWNGERVGAAADAAVRVKLHQAASLKAMADPSLGSLARAYVGATSIWRAMSVTSSRAATACATRATVHRKPERTAGSGGATRAARTARTSSTTTTCPTASTVCGWTRGASIPAPISRPRT